MQLILFKYTLICFFLHDYYSFHMGARQHISMGELFSIAPFGELFHAIPLEGL